MGMALSLRWVGVRRVWVVFLETRVATRRDSKMERASSCGEVHTLGKTCPCSTNALLSSGSQEYVKDFVTFSGLTSRAISYRLLQRRDEEWVVSMAVLIRSESGSYPRHPFQT